MEVMNLNEYYMTVHEMADRIKKRETSSEEVTRAMLDRIMQVDPQVGAYISVVSQQALDQAREVDKLLARGETLPALAGVPMALKDNICTEGIATTCASKMLQNFVPSYSATVYKRLRDAGAVLLGKTNMDEFAMGSSTENSGFKKTRNPWDMGRVPGGSSGGSAAAVAAGMAYYALGSDTGGSIRQPASFCGIVGLKPTYGRVSRNGVVAFASSLDQVGTITRDVTDCAIVMNQIAGHDRYDSTSADVSMPDYTASLTCDISGLRVAIPDEYFTDGIDPAVKDAVMTAIEKAAELGAVCDRVSLPHTEYALPAFYIISSAEASSNLARYDGVRYGFRADGYTDITDMMVKTRSQGFGPEVKRRIMLGTYALSAGYYDAYYKKAMKVRTLVKADFDRVFENYHVVMCPTSPTVAFKAGEKTQDPLQMYLSDAYTISVNIAGLPAMSIPCGQVDGLPVGLQIIGRPFDEGTLLRVAYTLEQNMNIGRAWPKI